LKVFQSQRDTPTARLRSVVSFQTASAHGIIENTTDYQEQAAKTEHYHADYTKRFIDHARAGRLAQLLVMEKAVPNPTRHTNRKPAKRRFVLNRKHPWPNEYTTDNQEQAAKTKYCL